MAVSTNIMHLFALFAFSTGFTKGQLIPPGSIQTACDVNVDNCFDQLQSSIISHQTDLFQICRDVDNYEVCLRNAGCGYPDTTIDTLVQSARSNLAGYGTLQCNGIGLTTNLPVGPVFTALPGVVDPTQCHNNMQDCYREAMSDMSSHVGNVDMMCSDLVKYEVCLVNTGCGMTQVTIDTQVQQLKDQWSSQIPSNCNAVNSTTTWGPLGPSPASPPTAVPIDQAACTANSNKCSSQLSEAVTSHPTDNFLICKDIDRYVDCLRYAGCGFTQTTIDAMLQGIKAQLAAQGTVNCEGLVTTSSPSRSSTTHKTPACRSAIDNCNRKFSERCVGLSYSDCCNSRGEHMSEYLQCYFYIDGCYIPYAERQQIMQATQTTMDRLYEGCEIYSSGQARLSVIGATVLMFLSAVVLATKSL